MGYKIGSFNMYKWSDGSNNKNLASVANIIRTEQFDIVALQEVCSKDAVKSLMGYLHSWDYRWEKPKKSSSPAAEGYAFIWNTRRFSLSSTEENGVKKLFEPRILDQYKVDTSISQSKLIRNPYFGRFTPSGCYGGCFVEFRLINTHINFGKKEGEDGSSDSPGAFVQRNKEYDILSEAIYPKYADRRYGNNMPAYTIILGDYNLNLRDSKLGTAYLKNDSMLVTDAGRNKLIQTFQSELTTLSTKDITEDPKYERSIYANNYDHFSFDVLAFNDNNLKTGIGRVDAVRKYYAYERDKYKSAVSDHIPIYMTIDF